MQFGYSEKVEALRGRVQAFMDEHVYPNEATYAAQLAAATDRWQPVPIVGVAEGGGARGRAVEPVPRP